MHNPFKKITLKENLRTKEPEQLQMLPREPEEKLFAQAMRDVTPLQGKGRNITPSPAKLPALKKQQDQKAKEISALRKKSIAFDLESTPEYIQGCIKGLDQKIFRKLKTGKFGLEAHLDLHGLTVDQAELTLLDFMEKQYQQKKHCVLLITGRGRRSPLGIGVLRQGVQIWLTQEPLKRIVLAFCTACSKHGGSGALYVLLRRNKKNKEKKSAKSNRK